jgi:predicted phosphodiesterase
MKTNAPAIATFDEMAKVLPRVEEAVVRPREEAPPLNPLERARLLGALNNAMAELRKIEEKPDVMTTPRDQFASILQSTFVEMAQEKGRVQLVKGVGILEAKFDKTDPGWVSVAWEKLKLAFRSKIGWIRPGAPERLPAVARIAIFGDWATGLYGAPEISRSIETDKKHMDAAVHLGDTYYSGTENEFRTRFAAFWPQRRGMINRAVNGNHEMYSGGKAYLDMIQRDFRQRSTGFALENEHWLLIGMDTALVDHDIDDRELQWLEKVLSATEKKVLLFSHHQPFSRFEGQGPRLVEKLRPWLDGGRIHGWYWGHEHRCVLFDKHPRWRMWGRCVGHGGIPEFRSAALGPCPRTPRWRDFAEVGEVPAGEVLDGPNENMKRFQKLYSPHGYAVLTLEGDRLIEEVRDARGGVMRQPVELA